MMKYPSRRWILPALPVLACALPAFAQTYTDEQINIDVCNLPYTWNMLSEQYSYQPYCSTLPSGFNPFNIIGTGVFIHADRSQANGNSLSASTLYRLHTLGQTQRRLFGGEYTYWCYGTRCDVDMTRGYAPLDSNDSRNYYQSSNFDNTALRRVFAVTEYINTGVASVTKNSNDYYFPIGGWDMTVTSATSPIVKSVPLPGLEINRIANVSTIILSNPINGKVKADQFDRRGMLGVAGDPYPHLFRGGIVDVKQSASGTACQVDLTLYNTEPFWRPGNPANAFSGQEYKGTATNRGWVKVTYYGSVPGLLQPVAIKTLVKPIGAWPISTRDNGGDRYRIFPYAALGVAGNRLASADVTIHRDDGGGLHAVAPLRRTPYNGQPSGGTESGTFTIDETMDRFTMIATYKNNAGYNAEGYYSQNHYSGDPYNRGWYRIDYVAGTCATAATGYSIKGIPSATNGTCGGGSGTSTTVEGAGRDIWDVKDEFTFMYKKFTAGENKTFTAKIESQANTEGWAKAGLMFRSSLAANAKHASLLATPVNGTHFTWRPDGTNTVTSRTSNTTVKAPYWLRVQKVGKVFTAFWSSNGSTWSQVGSPQTINSFGSTFFVGFAVSSRTSGMSKAVFSNVGGI